MEKCKVCRSECKDVNICKEFTTTIDVYKHGVKLYDDGKYTEALKYFLYYYNIKHKICNDDAMYIGNIYAIFKDYESAKYYYVVCDNLTSLYYLSQIYKHEGNDKIKIAYLTLITKRAAENISHNVDDDKWIYKMKSIASYELGLIEEQKPGSNINDVIKLYEESLSYGCDRYASMRLGRIYEKCGNFRSAYEQYESIIMNFDPYFTKIIEFIDSTYDVKPHTYKQIIYNNEDIHEFIRMVDSMIDYHNLSFEYAEEMLSRVNENCLGNYDESNKEDRDNLLETIEKSYRSCIEKRQSVIAKLFLLKFLIS